MSGELGQYQLDLIQDTIRRLQSPITDLSQLLLRLAAPLAAVDLLPAAFLRYNTQPFERHAFAVYKHVPMIQSALLQHVIPAWYERMQDEKAEPLIRQMFCPDSFVSGRQISGELALCAFNSILSYPLSTVSVLSSCETYLEDLLSIGLVNI